MKPALTAALVALSFAVSGCSLSRRITIPDDASPQLRSAYAGKTLMCAGTAREISRWMGIGGGLLAGAGTALSGAALAQDDPDVASALGVSSIVVGSTGALLTLWAFFQDMAGNSHEYQAGRILSGDSALGENPSLTNTACVMGDDPMAPVTAPAPDRALPSPAPLSPTPSIAPEPNG